MTRPAMTGASTSPLRPAAATPLSRVRKIPDVRLVDRAVQAEDDGDAAGSEALPESVRDLAGPGRVHKKHPHKQYTPAALRPAATQLFPAPPTEPTEPTERAHRPSTRPATPPPPPRDGRRASPSRPSSPSEPEPTEPSNDAVSESFLDPDEIASLKREITRTRVARATAGAHAARPRLALNGADDRKRELSARMTAWTASLDDPNQAHRTHRRLPSDHRPRDRLDLSHAPRRAAPPTAAASTARRHVHPPTEAMPPEVAGLTEADLERPLPFITSGRGGKSYSVTANFQKVLGLLKAHHRARCPSCVQAARSPSHQHQHPHDHHHPPALSPYPAASRAGKAGPPGRHSRPYRGDTQDHLTHDDASYASRESCHSCAEDGRKPPATRSTHAARHIPRDAPSRPVATSAPKPRAFAHTRSSTMNSLDHLDPALFTGNGAVPRVVAALREELAVLTDQYQALEVKYQRRAAERNASRHGRSSSDRRDGTRRPVGSSPVAQDVRDHQLVERLRRVVALMDIKKEQITLLQDMALTRDGEMTPMENSVWETVWLAT
ncbi:hypothetical protein CXG81DRAFT_21393 [Caulochytrium protostelioides]|uniref:Uncharacterized protein n=1 Tax=Caulochytrium protostelioides TaxID=1555241 RepID=A0A4P9X097_9FUNG|nr:hypothetical protein CXG81DRAFT_21393 [Caulochytrium protostelioides]|eukprot:RKO98362.1 hypothetical protein CXG81DRAFT_21393 [Caulochytrium protostelioides]